MASIEEIDVDDFPFGLGARALVRAVAGDTPAALADAEALEERAGRPTSTSPLGRLGARAGVQRGGDGDADRRWLERSGARGAVGDVAFLAVVER